MRREDAVPNGGARLVVLGDGGQHYLRLLVPKEGRNTFFTPALRLDPRDLQALAGPRGVYRCYVGTMLVQVDDENGVVVWPGDHTVWGQRLRLTEALGAIAR